jgi:hypothetical protein
MRQGFASRAPLASRGRRLLTRFALAASLTAVLLAASASPAGGSVTIGQVANPQPIGCGGGYDWAQPTVTSGNTYVVPGTGGITAWTVTSWTTYGGPSESQVTMKIFRKLAGPSYQVVGHSGPQTVTPGGTAGNTFPSGLAVKPGDVLGFHTLTLSYCDFTAAGEEYLYYLGNLADGAQASFGTYSNSRRLNISAVVTPTNTFSRAGTQRNKKKGTATLTLNLPNPGQLTGSGKGVKAAGAAVISKTVSAPGETQLLIKAKGRKNRKLNETGKVKLNVKVTYTPTGGDPSTQSVKVKLKKR